MEISCIMEQKGKTNKKSIRVTPWSPELCSGGDKKELRGSSIEQQLPEQLWGAATALPNPFPRNRCCQGDHSLLSRHSTQTHPNPQKPEGFPQLKPIPHLLLPPGSALPLNTALSRFGFKHSLGFGFRHNNRAGVLNTAITFGF